MRVALAVDHAGVPLRTTVLETVRDGGYEVHDLAIMEREGLEARW